VVAPEPCAHAVAGEGRLHPLGLPQCESAPAGPELERASHVSRFPLLASSSKCRTIASTRPATVSSRASMATVIPRPRALPAVSGPITAAAKRPDAATGPPTI